MSNDSIEGGGSDLFNFLSDQRRGDDKILDFEVGTDTIMIGRSTDGIYFLPRNPTPGPYSASFADLSISQSGDDTVITYSGGTIRLVGVQSSQITADDFEFGLCYSIT